MKTEEFNYNLPKNLIAQSPFKDRDTSRLLVLDKKTGDIEHKKFSDIICYINKNDVLVLNDTKVIPARLIGKKESTGGVIELLLLNEIEDNIWECLTKPARRIKTGYVISFGDGLLKAVCIEVKEEGIRVFKLKYEGILYDVLNKLGETPLPPYIYTKLENKNSYQTVYAKNIGSIAAPTAGLHFTTQLLKNIKSKGIKIAYITLHVGLGTFRPVKEEDITKHKMHSEFYEITKETADILNIAIQNKNNIICVGTTTVRTLETVYQKYNCFKEDIGWTNIFIYPGYKFKTVDKLITNFHLPKSTLLMLVSALAGKEKIFKAYNEAINKKYRFFSFGDSMLIK